MALEEELGDNTPKHKIYNFSFLNTHGIQKPCLPQSLFIYHVDLYFSHSSLYKCWSRLEACPHADDTSMLTCERCPSLFHHSYLIYLFFYHDYYCAAQIYKHHHTLTLLLINIIKDEQTKNKSVGKMMDIYQVTILLRRSSHPPCSNLGHILTYFVALYLHLNVDSNLYLFDCYYYLIYKHHHTPTLFAINITKCEKTRNKSGSKKMYIYHAFFMLRRYLLCTCLSLGHFLTPPPIPISTTPRHNTHMVKSKIGNTNKVIHMVIYFITNNHIIKYNKDKPALFINHIQSQEPPNLKIKVKYDTKFFLPNKLILRPQNTTHSLSGAKKTISFGNKTLSNNYLRELLFAKTRKHNVEFPPLWAS